jgi:hypothetical protein
MKQLLIRFWQWLGRVLGIETTAPPAQSTGSPPVAPPPAAGPPPVTLPPPKPPEFDLHTSEVPIYGRKSSILTQPEQRLYKSLLTAVGGDHQVMSKVRLGDFVWLTNDPPDRKQHLNKIWCRHVDFLICEPLTLAPRLVIELDDYSHKNPQAQANDQFKDELFASAGLPILRLNHPNYPPRILRDRIAAALNDA